MEQSNSLHYRDGMETVVHQEQICKLLEEAGIPSDKIHFIATAIKYAERAGKKEGESFEKDCYKEADYLCRALTGQWLHECEK